MTLNPAGPYFDGNLKLSRPGLETFQVWLGYVVKRQVVGYLQDTNSERTGPLEELKQGERLIGRWPGTPTAQVYV